MKWCATLHGLGTKLEAWRPALQWQAPAPLPGGGCSGPQWVQAGCSGSPEAGEPEEIRRAVLVGQFPNSPTRSLRTLESWTNQKMTARPRLFYPPLPSPAEVWQALHRPQEFGRSNLLRSFFGGFMDRIAAPVGRDQRPPEGQAESPTRDRVQKQHQNPDALDALPKGQARLEAGTPSLGTPSAGLSSHAKDYPNSVRILTDESGPSSAPPSPSTRPASLATATTAVSSPARPRAYFRSSSIFRDSEPGTMRLLVVLARLAAFTVSLMGSHETFKCVADRC